MTGVVALSTATGRLPQFQAFTDGGTSAFLSITNSSISYSNSAQTLDCQFLGNGTSVKAIRGPIQSGGSVYSTFTANSGFINAVGVNWGATSPTVSGGIVYLYGWRT